MQQNICIIVVLHVQNLSILGQWNLQVNSPTLRTLRALTILLQPLAVSVCRLSQLGTF